MNRWAGKWGMGGLVLAWFLGGASSIADEIPAIERRIPPAGIPIPEEVRSELLESLQGYEKTYAVVDHPLRAHGGVFLKAVRFALENGEFYREEDFDLAKKMLLKGGMRLWELAKAGLDEREIDLAEWLGRGLVVGGYTSRIDGSLQPFGLEVPEEVSLEEPVPLLVWLHGRGDKVTDLHFLERCLTRSQSFQGKNAGQQEFLVLHAFGRQCMGWKHSGEVDVHEVIEVVSAHYPVDPDRVVLAGFSMGGAGAWHLGAHYTDQFAAVHAGAGFAETARYNRLAPEDYPVDYEQVLWGLYDVPGYVRNLFNVPVVAYSGEEDKQKQAADVMAEAFAAEGRELTHLIGPGMGHKYHEDSIKPILEVLRAARRNPNPASVEWQGRTLRYGRMHWLQVTSLEEHWQDSRVSASREDGWKVTTKNVNGIELAGEFRKGEVLRIDGQEVTGDAARNGISLVKREGTWRVGKFSSQALRKKPGLQGPIDDVWLEPFLVVWPDGESSNPAMQRWLKFEMAHFEARWKALFRGTLRSKRASEVTEEDAKRYHLVCWGDPGSNSLLKQMLPDLPLRWDGASLEMGEGRFDAAHHVPVLIYPNPMWPARYVVLNSGPTFREGHDRTNSLQNPKLPDWAVVDVRQDPDEFAPGRIAAAGFFDEAWRYRTRMSSGP